MSPDMRLWLFCLLVVAAAFVGGLVPWWGKLRPDRIPMLVSSSAGVLLGTAFFHLLPEAYIEIGFTSLFIAGVGLLSLYLLEKILRGYGHGHGYIHGEDHEHTHGHGNRVPARVSFIPAFVGLGLHSFFDGLALGASTELSLQWIIFLALLVHKAPTGFSLSAILRMSGVPFRHGLLFLIAFSFCIPLGVFCFSLFPPETHTQSISGYALAFSAGNFFHVAVDDLLPEVGREAKNKQSAVLGFIIGFVFPLVLWVLPEV